MQDMARQKPTPDVEAALRFRLGLFSLLEEVYADVQRAAEEAAKAAGQPGVEDARATLRTLTSPEFGAG